MGLTETEAEQYHKAHTNPPRPHLLTTELPFLHRPGILRSTEMGPEKRLGT